MGVMRSIVPTFYGFRRNFTCLQILSAELDRVKFAATRLHEAADCAIMTHGNSNHQQVSGCRGDEVGS
ncbi:unnamed protein product [Ilex paraguariensis]|uniref:Uncharacterized protein n=1 Tax=Ilex paraguariensis TaxID=185542 RepID=A0ABC8QRC0_9AQUA